jgi:two-component system OmpR family response regulator
MAQRGRHDLVLLDVMLPDVTGTEVCRRLRAEGIRTPVLFLTARDATEDKVAGLTVGGDDYVAKPFSLDELVARIHAVLRRTAGLVAMDGGRLVFADLEMDDDTHEVWRQGVLIDLTATEFNLLRYLLENARRVLSKSEIVDNVWSLDFDGDPNIVETYISYLRKKVDCVDPPLIHTIRGVGYSLRVAREREADGS